MFVDRPRWQLALQDIFFLIFFFNSFVEIQNLFLIRWSHSRKFKMHKYVIKNCMRLEERLFRDRDSTCFL